MNLRIHLVNHTHATTSFIQELDLLRLRADPVPLDKYIYALTMHRGETEHLIMSLSLEICNVISHPGLSHQFCQELMM